MTNNLLNEMMLDNSSGTYFLSPQTGPSKVNASSLTLHILTSLTSCTVTNERHKTWAVNMGINAHPINKGLNMRKCR